MAVGKDSGWLTGVRRTALLALAAGLLSSGCQRVPRDPRPPTREEAEAVKSYYRELVGAAQAIDIRPADGSGVVKTVTRAGEPDFFARVEAAVDNGFVKPFRCQCVTHWYLDVIPQQGLPVEDVVVCHYLWAPDQPYAGTFWFFPLAPGASEQSPGIIEEIDRLVGVRPGEE